MALAGLVALAGCAPTVTATPTIPAIPIVHVSPFALPLARSLGQTYIESQGPLPFDLVPANRPAAYDNVEAGDAALHIDFPPVPEGWFATPLGWEGITVIVHPEVPIRSLSVAELAGIYNGRIDDWQEFGRGAGSIQPVLPPAGDSMRDVFVGMVIPDDRITTLARLSPTPEEAIRIAQEVEGAIALVPAHLDLTDAEVSIIRIGGQLPEPDAIRQGEYELRARVVASAPEEPSGSIRGWLSWVQEQKSSE